MIVWGTFKKLRSILKKNLRLLPQNTKEAASALTNLAFNAMNQGHYVRARAYLEQAQPIFAALSPEGLLRNHYAFAWLALEEGQYLKARALLEEVCIKAQKQQLSHWHYLARALLAKGFMLEGNQARAQSELASMLPVLQNMRAVGTEIFALAVLGESYWSEGKVRSSLHCFAESLEKLLSTTQQSIPLILYRLVALMRGLLELNQASGLELYQYCQQHLSQMFVTDQQKLLELSKHLSKTEQGYHDAFLALTPYEVARIVLADYQRVREA